MSERLDPRLERSRAAVFVATLDLLATAGPAALTVDRLAASSGVSRSTIYRHWPDPAELALAAFEQAVHATPSAPATTGDLRAELSGYLTDYARRLNDSGYLAALAAILEWSLRDERFAELKARLLSDVRSRAAAILRRGRRSGQVTRSTPVAEQIEAVVAPFLYRALVLRRRITTDDVNRHTERLLTELAP